MATSSWNKFNDFTEQLVRGVHDWDAHTFKIALTNTAPTAAQISLDTGTSGNHPPPTNTNGYTAGGTALTGITVSESSGTTTVQANQVVFTATGALGPFRYAILYNDSATTPADALISWFDYNGEINLSSGETFTVKFNNTNPGTLFTVTPT